MSTTTQHKIIGATVRATNRTHGLTPARDSGKPETVTEVVDEYDMTIRTSEGNVYLRGGYTISHYAPAATTEMTFTQERDAHAARRAMIREGHKVSLVALDPSRDLYVFDAYDS